MDLQLTQLGHRPRIALIASSGVDLRSDARLKLSAVGTIHYMAQALDRHCGSVSALTPARFASEKLGRFISRGLRKVWGRTYDHGHTLRLAGQYARYYDTLLQRSDADIIFAPLAATQISGLKSHQPVLYLSDATFDLVNNYYPEYSSLTVESVRQGNEIERRAVQRASALVYPTQWAADSAIDRYGANPQHIHIIPFGANIDNAPPFMDCMNRDLTNVCRLILVGTNWRRKGGDLAIATMDALTQMGVASELVVCGCRPPSDLRRPYLTVIPFLDKNQPEHRQRFADLLLSAHFMLLPTRSESFGLVFCEAAAFGLPVVATATGGVGEVVINGENGYTLPPGAGAREYAHLIKDLFRNKQRYALLAHSSRAAYERRLNWDVWGVAMERVIHGMLRQTAGV